MNWNVLVLDQGDQPIKIVSWEKAITLIILGKAELVADSGSIEVRTFSKKFSLTTIIRQLKSVYLKRKKSVPFSRRNILLRDKFACQYCGKVKEVKKLTCDHILPKSRGGEATWLNMVTACFPCNQQKSNRTPEEAGMKLLKKPVQPNTSVEVNIRLTFPKEIPECWRIYLEPDSFVYWHAGVAIK